MPFAKLSWPSLAQTLAELAVDRGKWTRHYASQRYGAIGGGSTEIQKNIIADRAIAMPGQSRTS